MVDLPNRVESDTIRTCVYVPKYKFKKCTIATCKNHTPITTTCCLAIDRVQPIGNKIISDSELHLFKFSTENVTSRLVSLKRKKAVTRVKSILILYSYIEFIKENYKPNGTYFQGTHITKAENSFPLKVKKLSFKNWMWVYLVNPKIYAKFIKKKEGECSAFKVHMLLDMTLMKYDVLLTQVQPMFRKIANEHTKISHSQADNSIRARGHEIIVGVGKKQFKPKR